MSDPVEEAALLPLEQKLVHSNWKVRSLAYEELTKKFLEAVEASSSIYSEYSGFLKKIFQDKNAAALEKGLDAIYAFYDRFTNAQKFTSSLVPLLVEKCFGGRHGTKKKSMDLVVIMVEVDTTGEPVTAGLIEGTTQKAPKNAISSLQALESILRIFGTKVIPLKPILNSFLGWFEHTNSEFRSCAQSFTIELYKWVGGSVLDKYLSNLRPAQLSELQKAFETLTSPPPVPLKYLRCQVDQIESTMKISSENVPLDADDSQTTDLYSLTEAADVVSQIKSNFCEQLESKKWKEKKEALEGINKLVDVPRLVPGDYSELTKNLKRLMADANVFVIEETIRCYGYLANALRTDFSVTARSILCTILEKFKERKLINAIHSTLEKFYYSFSLSDVFDEITSTSKNKVPQVRRELLVWIKKTISKEKRPLLVKNIKYWCTLLMELMDDSDSNVRDNAFESFGIIVGLVGERTVSGYINQLEKVKEKRIREFIPTTQQIPNIHESMNGLSNSTNQNKIDINANLSASAKVSRAPAKKTTQRLQNSSNITRTIVRKNSNLSKSLSNTSSVGSSAGTKVVPPSIELFNAESRFGVEEIEGKCDNEILSESLKGDLRDKSWKIRLGAIKEILSMTSKYDQKKLSKDAFPMFLYLTVVSPTLREPNTNVLNQLMELLINLIRAKITWNKNDVYIAIVGFIDRFSDTKLQGTIIRFLNSAAESINLQYIFNALYTILKDHKNPKVVAEGLNYMCTSLAEFGHDQVDFHHLILFLKQTGFETINPTIKVSATKVLKEMYKSGGPSLLNHMSTIRLQVLTNLKKEVEKLGSQKPSAPIRGPNAKVPIQESSECVSPNSLAESLESTARVDLAQFFNEIVSELDANNWQQRQEALAKIEAELIQARKIQFKGVSALISALKPRLTDANTNLIPQTLNILGKLAIVVGPQIEPNLKIILNPILNNFGNNKATVRTAALNCLNDWSSVIGIDSIITYLSKSLATLSGRTELFNWIANNVKKCNKTDYKVFLKFVFSGINDKSKEIRTSVEQILQEIFPKLDVYTIELECSKIAPNQLPTVKSMLKKMNSAGKIVLDSPEKSKYSPSKITESSIVENETLNSSDVNSNSFELGLSPQKFQMINGNGPFLYSNTTSEREKEDLNWTFGKNVPQSAIESLKNQFQPCIALPVLSSLFSSEAKDRVESMEMLEMAFESQSEVVKGCLDVILKWASWRLYDDNLVILKRVVNLFEYIYGMFEIWKHNLTDLEASSFIPILLIRQPFLSENLQEKIQKILRQTGKYYPSSKLFRLIKNSLETPEIPDLSLVNFINYLSTLLMLQNLSVCDPVQDLPFICKFLSRDEIVAFETLKLFKIVNSITKDFWSFLSESTEEQKSIIRDYIESPDSDKYTTRDIPVFDYNQKNKSTSLLGNSKELSSSMTRPILEKVKVSQSSKFELDLESLKVDTPAEVSSDQDLSLPPGFSPTNISDLINRDIKSYLISGNGSKLRVNKTSSDKDGTHIEILLDLLRVGEISQKKNILKSIQDSMRDHVSVLAFHCNEFIPVLSQILVEFSDDQDLVKQTCMTLISIFTGYAAKLISRKVLSTFIEVSIKSLLSETIRSTLDCMNSVISVAIGNEIDISVCYIILFDLLRNHLKDAEVHFVSVICKCITRKNRILPNCITKLNVGLCLRELHMIFTSYPPHTWASMPFPRALDQPKEFISIVVQLIGLDILKHSDLIPKTIPPSPINWYIKSELEKLLSGHGTDILNSIPSPESNPENSPISSFEPFKGVLNHSDTISRINVLSETLGIKPLVNSINSFDGISLSPESISMIINKSSNAEICDKVKGIISEESTTSPQFKKDAVLSFKEKFLNSGISSSTLSSISSLNNFKFSSINEDESSSKIPTNFALPDLNSESTSTTSQNVNKNDNDDTEFYPNFALPDLSYSSNYKSKDKLESSLSQNKTSQFREKLSKIKSSSHK